MKNFFNEKDGKWLGIAKLITIVTYFAMMVAGFIAGIVVAYNTYEHEFWIFLRYFGGSVIVAHLDLVISMILIDFFMNIRKLANNNKTLIVETDKLEGIGNEQETPTNKKQQKQIKSSGIDVEQQKTVDKQKSQENYNKTINRERYIKEAITKKTIFNIGDMISHPKYGIGEIVRIYDGYQYLITVNFGDREKVFSLDNTNREFDFKKLVKK